MTNTTFPLDADAPTATDAGHASIASARPVQLAQGIFCDPWALAVPYGWAKSVVEEFNLVAIPKSPEWIVGLTNVEGVVMPVIDLGIYFTPGQPAGVIGRNHRLLVGGGQKGDSENVFALLFTRLPMQIRYHPEPMAASAQLPERLIELCTAQAKDVSGRTFLEINAANMVEALLSAI